jgi:N-acetylglucosaminyl-diphospho-decaprenol L-rhamnosyltransferase
MTSVQSISVCTVLYRSEDVISEFLTSLISKLESNDELLFFDNSESDDLARVVSELTRETSCRVSYFFNGENIGFARACNALSRHATNSRLVFLNPDTRTIEFDCRSHAPNEIVGARIRDSNDHDECTYGVKRGLTDEVSLRWLRRKGKRPYGVGYVSGAALSVDRSRFEEVGGFDERFFMYYEDIDLCLRMSNVGTLVRVSDAWVVVHKGGSSARKLKKLSEIRSFESSFLFHEKWHGSVRTFTSWCLIDALLRLPVWLVLGQRTNLAAQWSLTKHIARSLRGTLFVRAKAR